ncbi:MAG: copper-translocating P-type ATPase [Proteiniphilum sp.]|nr:copper-translocating P-type ATPase [Proteiniphilum sp.]
MDTTGNHIVKNSFPVLNMTCTSCAAGVESKVSSLNGVKSASVNFATESVQVEYDNEKISPADIKKAVQEIGYDIFLEDSKDIHKKETFLVLKMTCTSCAAGVEKTISSLEGVNFAAVNFATESVQVDYIPSKINPIDIQKAIRESGYDMIIEEDKSHKETLEEIHDKRHKALKHKTRWAIILATPVMIIGMFMMDLPYANLIMLVLSSPVVLWLGRDFFINAWKQAKNRTANMDTLVALSTGTAYIFSLFNMLFPQVWESKGLEAHVYFEAAAVIIAFILIGKLLEERAKGNTSSALKKLMGLQPKTVTIVKDGAHIETLLEDVAVDDIILVKPGEKIAVDGTLLDGESFVDESMLSGEPMAVRKIEGEKVFAGTINQKGSFQFKANKVGKDTMLAQIIKMVQDAQGSKAPVQKLVDKIASIFVPVVIGTAVLTFIVWMVFGGDNALTHALLAFVTVLVIACPCALGLATPTAVMVGIGKGAEQGILIKDAESLETSKNVDVVVLDKTGTITEGKPQVTEEYWVYDSSKSILASLEKLSEHPLADALVEHLNGELEVSISNFSSITGKGIVGTVDGEKYFAGNNKLLVDNNVSLPEDLTKIANKWSDEGKTVIWFANSKKVLAIVAISDKIKESSLKAINSLHEMGIKIYMLTGDNAATSKFIAEQAGIDHFKAEVLPHEKAEFVKELQEQDHTVAMVGDGINDSAALAQADVSIAMGQGSDIAMDVAKMTIISSDLTKIPQAIKLSKQTVNTIRQNLFWAFIYNVIGIPIAAGVLYPINGFLLSPMIAGAAMALSSVSVVSNSLRLKMK